MKNFTCFFLMICCFCTGSLFGQSEESWLSIGVLMPKQDSTAVLTTDQARKLENKVISLIAKNGITHNISAFRLMIDDPTTEDFMKVMAKGIVCIPKFEIYDSKVVDTGMKKLKVVDATLTLTVQYIYEDIIFSDVTVQLQGSGSSESQAIIGAIRSIDTGKGRPWAGFMDETRSKIIGYYDGMCYKLLEQAQQLNRLNLTGQALSILWPIPKEVECHSVVAEETVIIYENHINQECRKNLTKAKAKLAGNFYDEGLDLLGNINPQSDCYDEALQLISNMQVEMDDNLAANRNAQLDKLRQQVDLERYKREEIERISAKDREEKFEEKILIFNKD